MERGQAEAVATAIRSGRGDLAAKADIRILQWMIGLHAAVSLATLAAVLWLAARLA